MHVILDDGRIFTGYDAYRQLAWVLPATWLLLPILYLPPVRWVGWKAYRHIASHRHDAGCDVVPSSGKPTERPEKGTGESSPTLSERSVVQN